MIPGHELLNVLKINPPRMPNLQLASTSHYGQPYSGIENYELKERTTPMELTGRWDSFPPILLGDLSGSSFVCNSLSLFAYWYKCRRNF